MNNNFFLLFASSDDPDEPHILFNQKKLFLYVYWKWGEENHFPSHSRESWMSTIILTEAHYSLH
jgi:hypothetical protein